MAIEKKNGLDDNLYSIHSEIYLYIFYTLTKLIKNFPMDVGTEV